MEVYKFCVNYQTTDTTWKRILIGILKAATCTGNMLHNVYPDIKTSHHQTGSKNAQVTATKRVSFQKYRLRHTFNACAVESTKNAGTQSYFYYVILASGYRVKQNH